MPLRPLLWSALGPHTTALLRGWRATHPDTPLELLRIDERTAGLRSGPDAGGVDVAVLREPPALPGVRTAPLLTEARMAAVPADGPLAARDALAMADLAAHAVAVNTVSGTTTPALWPAGARPRAACPWPTPTTGWPRSPPGTSASPPARRP